MSLLPLFALTMQAAAPAPAPLVAAEEKKTCRRAQATLTRIGAKRICHTPAEWAEIDRAAATSVDTTRAQTRNF